MPDHDAQMLKGVLGLLLLRLLAVREDYGYAIVERLQAHGFSGLAEGTVYPALSRLESQGLLAARLVRSASGPARKYYRPTTDGLTELAAAERRWTHLVRSVDAVAALDPPDGASAPATPPAEGSPR